MHTPLEFKVVTVHEVRSHLCFFKVSVRNFIAQKKYAPAIAALVFFVGYSNLTIPLLFGVSPLTHSPCSPLFDCYNASRHLGTGLADAVVRFVYRISRSGELRK